MPFLRSYMSVEGRIFLAFILGSPVTTPFDHWIQQSPNIVAVAVYYRLDSFGFLPFPTTNSSIADHNAGLLDQTEALRWVQRHIDSFGGDPGHVTLNGQSAGGASVEYHLIFPRNDELFPAAIPQSVYRVPFRTVDEQQVRGSSDFLCSQTIVYFIK